MNRLPGCPYPIHPLALRFPALIPVKYAALLASISAHGLRRPIVVWQGQIIDGVHRLKACLEAGIEPVYEFPDDDADPLPYLADENVSNRNMSQNDLAVVAYSFSQWSSPGRPRADAENCANLRNYTQTEAADLLGVSRRLVTCAVQVLSEDSTAVLALQQAVMEWRIRCSDAAKIVDRPPEVQDRAVALVTSGKIKTIRRAVQEVEQEVAQGEAAAALADVLARPLDETIVLHTAAVADLRGMVAAGSVDAVITHPPYTEEALPMLSALADFAAHALKSGGVMVVVGNGISLPRMLEQLAHPELRWLAEFDLVFHGRPASSGRPHHMALHRRPLLVYGKGSHLRQGMDDLIEVPAAEEIPSGISQNEAAMVMVLDRFCRPGHTVCDPLMLDRAGTALAARKAGCTFVGASEQKSSIDRIRVRLARAGDEPGDHPAVNAEAEGLAAAPPAVGTPSQV